MSGPTVGRLFIGTVVLTTKMDVEKATQWTHEGQEAKKWGFKGVVIEEHDSHGLCYDVLHQDGTIGCYEPTELEVLGLVWDKF